MDESFDRDVLTVLKEMEYSGDIDDASVEFDNFCKSGSRPDDWFFDKYPDVWATLG